MPRSRCESPVLRFASQTKQNLGDERVCSPHRPIRPSGNPPILGGGHGMASKDISRGCLFLCLLLYTLHMTLYTTAAQASEDLVSIQASFLRGEFEEVVKRTQHLLTNPDATSRDVLLYLHGVSALKIGEMGLARSTLQEIAEKYPKSPWCSRANELLHLDDFYFTVQAGAFESKANALRLQSELARRGYDTSISDTVMQGRRIHRVRVGRFARREEAEREAERLRVDGFPTRVFP